MCRAKSRKGSMDVFIETIQNTFSGFDTIYAMLLKRYCVKQDFV